MKNPKTKRCRMTKAQSEQLAEILVGLCQALKMKPGQLFDEIMVRGRKALRN